MTRVETFRGWRVLGAATLGLALGYSNVGAACFGLFILPLSKAFGWGRGDISVALFLMNCTLIVLAPLVGVLVDRIGVRRVLLPSIFLFSLAIASLSVVKGNIHVFYALYVLVTVLGIGTIPATYTRVVVAWFDRRRGLAIGIAMAGIGVGATLLPPLVQTMMREYGWQAGYLTLGALVLFLALPVVAWLLRERPEDMGQTADGIVLNISSSPASGAIGYEFSECLRQRSFWLMALSFPLLGLFTAGILAHLVPLLQDRGVTAARAVLGASLLGLSLIFGRITSGLLLDRFSAPRVVAGFLLGPVIGLALLASGVSGGGAFVGLLLTGLGIGAELDFMSYLVSRYLGSRSYGRIYGIMYSAFAVGAAVGPILMGYTQQHTGRYDAALWGLCAATALAILPLSRLGAYPHLPGASAVSR